MDNKYAPVAHISAVGQPTGRRVNDSRETRSTLCGAPVTAADVTPADARVWIASAWTQGPPKCSECFRLLSPKPLTADQKDGGARFEAQQNAGLDY